MHVEVRQLGPSYGRSLAGLAPIITAVGEEHFGHALQSLLTSRCGATFSIVVSLDKECPSIITAESEDGTDRALREMKLYMDQQDWMIDPAIYQGNKMADTGGFGLLRIPRAALGNELGYRLYGSAGVTDRLVLVGQVFDTKILIALTKISRFGMFNDGEVAALQDISPNILAAAAKHSSLLASKDNFLEALTSLNQIELIIGSAEGGLTCREKEVCARILYGISTAGIALDLKISEETVATYRNRAYQRLGIGSQRELFLWYTAQWARDW